MADGIFGKLKSIFTEHKDNVIETTKNDIDHNDKLIQSLPKNILSEESKRTLRFVNRDPDTKKKFIIDALNSTNDSMSMSDFITKGAGIYSHITIRKYVKLLEEEGKIKRDPNTRRYKLI